MGRGGFHSTNFIIYFSMKNEYSNCILGIFVGHFYIKLLHVEFKQSSPTLLLPEKLLPHTEKLLQTP